MDYQVGFTNKRNIPNEQELIYIYFELTLITKSKII